MDVDLIGCVGVGLGGTYGCRCGVLYAPMLGVVFYARMVSPTSSSYPSQNSPTHFFVPLKPITTAQGPSKWCDSPNAHRFMWKIF